MSPRFDCRASTHCQSLRRERFQHRTGTNREGAESSVGCLASQRSPFVIEHYDIAAAYQEAPFTSDAVVDAGFVLEHRMITQRSDCELMT